VREHSEAVQARCCKMGRVSHGAPRILIFTASVGEGHDRPARTLAAQLRDECPDVEIVTEDGLAAMGRVVSTMGESAPAVVFYKFRWLWDLGFWFFAGFGPTRRGTQALLERVGGGRLLRLVERTGPDAIVSVYPVTTEVLARLRRKGRIRVPVLAAITDLSALRYWAAPGADVHLLTHPESEEEVRAITGGGTVVQAVHGLTGPEFARPRSRADARAALGLPADGKIVLVSGGGWGVGNVEGMIDVALASGDVAQVVCLCGRNDELRERIDQRFGRLRVRAEGFTEQMGDWMAAADALIHSTGGLTILEAHIRGCPAISFGWGRGHIRMNNAAFRRYGLADVAVGPAELRAALDRALSEEKAEDMSFAALPSAASVVLEYAGGGGGQNGRGSSDDHERRDQNGAAERRPSPVLAADERGESNRNGDLQHDDDRADRARGEAAQSGHLGEQA
jgi:processive 1,2-diacylglycerol beta-glucosyltransferase